MLAMILLSCMCTVLLCICAAAGMPVGHASTACHCAGLNPCVLQVEAKVRELEDLKLPVKVNQDLLTGSTWTTLYTTSTGEPCSSYLQNNSPLATYAQTPRQLTAAHLRRLW
jgi:hypothetical protein